MATQQWQWNSSRAQTGRLWPNWTKRETHKETIIQAHSCTHQLAMSAKPERPSSGEIKDGKWREEICAREFKCINQKWLLTLAFLEKYLEHLPAHPWYWHWWGHHIQSRDITTHPGTIQKRRFIWSDIDKSSVRFARGNEVGLESDAIFPNSWWAIFWLQFLSIWCTFQRTLSRDGNRSLPPSPNSVVKRKASNSPKWKPWRAQWCWSPCNSDKGGKGPDSMLLYKMTHHESKPLKHPSYWYLDQKYHTRLFIIEEIIVMKVCTGDSDLHIWRWLKSLIEMLSIDGMSSDEAAEEDSQVTFIVRILIWRKDIEKYLAIIDTQRWINTDIFNSRGSQPVHRVHDGKFISNHDPVQGLPHTFYDDLVQTR